MDDITAGINSLSSDNVIALRASGHYINTHLPHC